MGMSATIGSSLIAFGVSYNIAVIIGIFGSIAVNLYTFVRMKGLKNEDNKH
jgi:hypothetical protein